MLKNLPYAQQAGTLEKMLEKIKIASVPEKFSQDFVSTKLSMKGGTPRSTIPFIKKMGFVTSDGTPTKRYSQFRNSDKSGYAVADAMREVFSKLFDMNEFVYELDNKTLKSLIVEATGATEDSNPVQKTVATFNVLKRLADFESNVQSEELEDTDFERAVEHTNPIPVQSRHAAQQSEGINLSYTINLNLPATTDVEVFNAIFRSLKQHLLQD